MASAELQKYVNEIGKFIAKNGGIADFEAVKAIFQASQVAMFTEKDVDYATRCTKKVKEILVNNALKQTNGEKDIWGIENFCKVNQTELQEVNLYYDILKQESFYDLQSFIYYMERNRMPEKRFYYPRRKTLRLVVDDLMDLDAGKYKFYGLSMPPRVGKSTTCIFFLNWVMMKRPNAHNAMCGHSGTLAKGFFKETLNLITSPDYTFKEMYEFWHPDAVLIRDKSAEDFTITLDKPDRFGSLTCRGIDGTWTGAVDISKDGYLYVDDLVKDREESMSMQRMEKLYQSYQNEVLDRKNDGAKELMVGTLWSVVDPLERTRVLFQDDKEYKFRRIPALTDSDKSNFDYEIGGFSNKYYIDLRKRLNAPEWEAKYQQKPFVREGLLFEENELRYFDGDLSGIEGECKTVAVIDPAFGGGDSLSMPICVDYGEKQKYIVDWVFNAGTQRVTVPLICNKIQQHMITRLQIEKNSGGQLLADNIKDELQKRGVFFCKIELVFSPVKMSKEDKISGYSDFVKENFIFLLPNVKKVKLATYKRSNEYQKAMSEVCMYSPQGKNLHDDAPDSLTQLAMFFEKKHNGEIGVIRNPFMGMRY